MKISKIISITIVLAIWCVVLSYGVAIRELSDRAKQNEDLNYLNSLAKGNWFVSEVGTGDYLITADFIAQHPELKSFSVDAISGKWYARINKRTNKVHFIWGSGIRLFERGYDPKREELDKIGRSLISKYQDLFPVQEKNLVLDRLTGRVVKNPNKHFIRYFLSHNGVPIQRAFIFFRISYGKLIQIGMTGLEGWQWIDTNPKISKEDAVNYALGYARMPKKYKVFGEPKLKIVPTTENALAIADPATPYNYKLVYEVSIEYNGIIGRWLSWIDATTGEIILFMDSNRYSQKGSVMGGIFVTSVDSNLDTVPGENCSGQRDMDQQAYVPFFFVPLRGIPVHDAISDIGGMYFFNGIGTASCSLDGKYFDANDIYFGYDPEVYADVNNELDLGTGGVDFTSGILVQDPTTSAVRNGYFHLNRVRLLTTQWIDEETLPWLGETVPANMNILDECNAYSTGDTVNFFVSSWVLGGSTCNNTGQIASVMMHEWGHCLDAWAGQGHGDFATGEGHADVMAFFNSHEDCLGPGFFTLNQCCRRPPCNDTNYYAYMANEACRAKGALRSMENYEDQYSYNTPVPDADATTSNIMTRCYPGGAGVPGPLGREVHCEGQIHDQIVWDLAKALQSEPEHLINGGWKYTEYLYYGAVNYGAEVYLTLMPDNYYDAYLAVDDDDGDLTNGTPHAQIIHDSYALHDLFTPAAIPTSEHCVAPTEPTLTAQVVPDGIKLTWTSVSNADKYILYWLYASPNGPAYLLYEGPETSYTLKIQISGTYLFAVQAVSADGCPSTMEGVASATIGIGIPDVKISNTVISDDPPNGNGDGYGDVGETLEFTIELYNQGETAATGITAKLIPLSAGVLMINDTAAYPDLDVGQSGTNSVPFIVYLTKALPCGANVKFRLDIMAQERIMDASFEVMMGSLTNVYLKDFETPLGTEWVLNNDSQTNAQFQYIADVTKPPWYHYPHSGKGVIGWNNCPFAENDDKAILKTDAFWNQFQAGEFAGLSFWHTYATEEVNDGLVIEISTDGGATWSDLRDKILYGGYNTLNCLYFGACWSKDLWGYCLEADDQEVFVDLSEYAGGAAPRIRWRAKSNSVCDCWGCTNDNPSDGWLIDDVAFKKCTIADRPAITFIEATIDDASGNNNGGIDQGEQVNIVVTLKNTSTNYGLTNVTATLIAKDAGVAVEDASGTFGDIAAGSTGDNSADPFTVYYAGPCKGELKFQLNISSDQGYFALEFVLVVGKGIVFYDDVESGQNPNITMSSGWKIYTDGQFATSGMNSYYIDDFSFMQQHFMDLSVSLPEADKVTMTFNHTFAFEDYYDGARMYISDDGGNSWTDLGPYMISGGYNENWYYDGEPIWTKNPFGWGDYGPPPQTAPEWDVVEIDLSEWAGKDVIIEWWVFSDIAADSCFPATSCPPWPHPLWGDGLAIDDIKIEYEQSCINCAFPEFTDIGNNFAKDYIRKLQCSAVASGCSSTKYCPSMTVSRQQMAKFICSAAQLVPNPTCQGVFTDVPASNAFCTFIEKLASTGIASGCTSTQYCPADPVNRAQMAVFLIRAMGLPPAMSCTGMFTDVPASNPFCTYIEELANQGVTSGCGPGLYCPSLSVKRDQMAVFLVKAFNL